MCLVEVGSILRLIKFEPMYYHHNNCDEVGLVVLQSYFWVIGKSIAGEDSATRPAPENWLAICVPIHETSRLLLDQANPEQLHAAEHQNDNDDDNGGGGC